MSFISYAQNFEDVMLWRALKHVPNGFYIDVGANDPLVDSVTLAFYERGWSGINVEPMRQFHHQLEAMRPRDINLQVAVGDAPGMLTLYEVPDTGLSTLDAAVAAKHLEAGRIVNEEPVEVMTLTQICERRVHGPVHFLKIDVEGLEAAVLRGMDFTRWRPWVLVIEATRPQSQERSDEEWRALVDAAGYTSAYFDGLNRFFVAKEHADLAQAFALPPNYFDQFRLREGHWYSWPSDEESGEEEIVRYRTQLDRRMRELQLAAELAREASVRALMEQRDFSARLKALERNVAAAPALAEHAVNRIFDLQEQLRAKTHHLHEVEDDLHEVEGVLRATRSSTSWRLTAPVRWVGGLRKAVREQGAAGAFVHGLKGAALGILRPFDSMSQRRPALRAVLVRFARFAGLGGVLDTLRPQVQIPVPEPTELTREAERVRDMLLHARREN